MQMVGNDMGDEVRAAINALSDTEKQDQVKLWQAIGTAIVTHITTNAVISTTVATPDTFVGTGTGTIA